MIPILSVKLKKVFVESHKQWEHNIRIYCTLNTEINIILLHWNKQNLESSIIQWGCCLLNENFHLVLMITCFTMQICHRLDIEPYGLYFGTRLTNTCLQSRHLHMVERHTHTMGFWTFSPLVPPHFDDWHCHLRRCRRSETADHQIW